MPILGRSAPRVRVMTAWLRLPVGTSTAPAKASRTTARSPRPGSLTDAWATSPRVRGTRPGSERGRPESRAIPRLQERAGDQLGRRYRFPPRHPGAEGHLGGDEVIPGNGEGRLQQGLDGLHLGQRGGASHDLARRSRHDPGDRVRLHQDRRRVRPSHVPPGRAPPPRPARRARRTIARRARGPPSPRRVSSADSWLRAAARRSGWQLIEPSVARWTSPVAAMVWSIARRVSGPSTARTTPGATTSTTLVHTRRRRTGGVIAARTSCAR